MMTHGDSNSADQNTAEASSQRLGPGSLRPVMVWVSASMLWTIALIITASSRVRTSAASGRVVDKWTTINPASNSTWSAIAAIQKCFLPRR